MNVIIKELRKKTNLTQKAFADMLGIPLSTLRKWEQGEASPPKYVVDLITKSLPVTNTDLKKIEGRDGTVYFYDPDKKQVIDQTGNAITITEDLDGVKEQNLKLYISDLFESFHEIQERFNRDCRYDKQEDIHWI